MKAVTFLLAAAAFGVHANHPEHESHGAHEHGHGQLNLVLDGEQLLIELQAPAADLVGFEHEAKSAEEKAKYAKALALLKQPDQLFRFSPDTGCTLTQQEVNAAQAHHEDEHDHGHEHEHEHAKEASGHDEHHDDEGEAGHADMGAMYTFTCRTPAKLSGLEATLFTVYPSLEKLSVQGILPTGQTAAELTPAANKLSW